MLVKFCISGLLILEQSTNGTKESMLVHMDGLEKMVQMRGGLLDGGFPAIVQRLIGWLDATRYFKLLK